MKRPSPTRRLIRRPVVQRHSAAALAAQVEEAQLEEQAEATVQRSPKGEVPSGDVAVQRHPLPRNREFKTSAAPTDANVNAAKALIVAEMPTIQAELAGTIGSKLTPDARKLLVPPKRLWAIDDAPDVGLNPPAAAQGEYFNFMIRSPYFYREDGTPDADFIKATLIHESLHVLSYNHTGLQDVSYEIGPGKTATIGESRAQDSLDEAVTERLSLLIYDKLYPNQPYKTNYWQSLRETGVHSTIFGLDMAAAFARQFEERSWTGGLADLVVKEGLLTRDELEKIYLKGSAGMDSPMRSLKAKYASVLRLWEREKAKAWSGALPAGVMPAGEWVETLNTILGLNAGRGASEAAAIEAVRRRTGGHELVPRDDPRSHLFGVKPEHARHPDDYTILKNHYPATKTMTETAVSSPEPRRWKGAQVAWDKATRGTSSTELAKAVKQQANDLGLGDRYPHVVIPSATTLASTPFSRQFPKDPDGYQAAVFNPAGPPIAGRSMADLSGVDPKAMATQVVERMRGGAYETQGKVVYANTVEERTLRHEVGHYKQDVEQGYNEATINAKLLEYHNIVTVENDHEAAKAIPGRNIRLSYSGDPKVLAQKDWDATLVAFKSGGDPPEFVLLRKLVKPLEREALKAIENALDSQPRIYTPGMKRYLKKELSREYFQASRFSNF